MNYIRWKSKFVKRIFSPINMILMQKVLILFCIPQSFNTNISHLLENKRTVVNTTRVHKYKMWFWTQKPVLKVRFLDFWYTKINLSQNIYFSYYSHTILKCISLKESINLIYRWGDLLQPRWISRYGVLGTW